jgi:stage II sporulation protein D
LIDSAANKVILRAKNLKVTVAVSANGINLGGTNYPLPKLFIKTDEGGVIILGGRRFRGNICFIRKPNQRLLVVNSIELEDYLKGILYHEVSHYWPTEVLKAQAVVSRTYALYQMRENAAKDYDVTADIYSQVYGGMTSERYRTNRAVGYTKGEVLVFRDKLFPAYFHATCGGHTENASLLWNVNIAPLGGVPCNFCRQSPHFNWQHVLSLDEIRKKLHSSGYDIGDIKTIAILSRTPSGRAKELKISAENKEIKISAKDIRNIIGPNILRSTNFNVSIVSQDVVFTGIGWGHGVGMCQWGAYFLSRHGRNYKEILRQYYPGSDVKTLGF